MKLNNERTSPSSSSGMTLPLYVFNEFWHVCWVGFAATFGPSEERVGKRKHSPDRKALQLKLVLNRNGREISPLMIEFPSDTLEVRSLATQIADAIAERVSARRISASAASN